MHIYVIKCITSLLGTNTVTPRGAVVLSKALRSSEANSLINFQNSFVGPDSFSFCVNDDQRPIY